MTTFLFFLVNPPLNEFVWAGWERKKELLKCSLNSVTITIEN